MDKIILKEIYSHSNKNKAKILARFFKTGKGQYGEGDIFWGLTVPQSREIAKKYKDLSKSDLILLLKNKVHEIRLIALLILVFQYRKANLKIKKDIVSFYLRNAKYVNNWDLVDLSAHYIVGDFLLKNGDRKILIKLANSKNLWEQRIAIISTFAFIYKGESNWTFKISKILLKHKHDLIHKAVGWMLREVGKRVSQKKLEVFLKKNIKKMSRTTLRYAIEKFPEPKRKYYLNLK